MLDWLYQNAVPIAAIAVTVILFFLGGLGSLIAWLIYASNNLSWQASTLNSSVLEAIKEAVQLRSEISKARDEMKDEVRVIHSRIDRHEERLGHIEGRSGSWSGQASEQG